jgi:hypothetical protein
MANPFPGVNPYIETGDDLWVGFHNTLVSFIGIQLNPILNPRGYAAYVEKRVDLAYEDDQERHLRADVEIAEASPRPGPASSAAAVLDIRPAEMTLPLPERIPAAYLEIRRAGRRKPVTSIEILSPYNKRGQGRRIYHRRRNALLATKVNLIEIDLLLAGRRPEVLGVVPAGDFYAYVSRGDRRPKCEVYAWSVRQPIPRLPVPLRLGDDDAVLDLAKAYAMTYDGGPYTFDLTYNRPVAGLSEDDQRWAAERTRGGLD